MISFYVKFVMIFVSVITPREANAVHCLNTDKKRINDVELLKHEVTKNDNTKPRSRCCPYDFDPSLCKIVGERLLCGYNRNIGGFQNDNGVELDNGCRIRGGRLECGYINGPFNNPRRPPAEDNVPTYDDVNSLTTINDVDKNGSGEVEDDKNIEPLKHVTSKSFYAPTTKCLEIRERVVCRHF